METFNGYFDRIHADQKLKERVKEVISMKEKEEVKVVSMKRGGKFGLALGMAAAFVILLAAGYIYYQKPVSYVSLDINPSVELQLNFMDRVVGSSAENADGEALLAGLRVQNLSVDSAISSLVQNAYDKGYVNEDGSTVISVTAITDDEEKASELQVKTQNGVALAMEAKKAGVSPGKYKLMKSLEVLDPEIDIEQYRNAKVNEIITKAQEIVQQKYAAGETQNNKELDEIIGKVKEAGKDIEESKEKAAKQEQEKETEQNQESNAYQNSFAGSNAASQAESHPGSQVGSQDASHETGSGASGSQAVPSEDVSQGKPSDTGA
ncbi:MAG: hypothetical protein PHU83_07580 [Eubacteriales bacterium]|nr:hypothetical protein [Eubacteriales bacterium]